MQDCIVKNKESQCRVPTTRVPWSACCGVHAFLVVLKDIIIYKYKDNVNMKDHGTSSDCHLYKLQCLPSKGYGVVATRDIQPSELIVRELPMIKVQLTADGDICGKFDLKRHQNAKHNNNNENQCIKIYEENVNPTEESENCALICKKCNLILPSSYLKGAFFIYLLFLLLLSFFFFFRRVVYVFLLRLHLFRQILNRRRRIDSLRRYIF